MCRGRVFKVNPSKDSCKSHSNPTLTYSQLTNYYNELVIQLRLAQYNLNVSIALEVKEEKINDALKREEEIIKLLNESILPAIETTVSSHYNLVYLMFTHARHSPLTQLNISSSNTNCSATEVLVDHMITLYANCAALQTSNTFLAQTSLSLHHILSKTKPNLNDNREVKTPDSNKKWCIV